MRPFPAPAGERQIPTEGDTQPAWVLNSRELFYRNGDKMMAAVVETKDVRYGQTQLLIETTLWAAWPVNTNYDVSPDGQRFLVIKATSRNRPPRK